MSPTVSLRSDPFQDLIVGASLPMRLLYKLMETAARTTVTVLLQGETGTGKELVARGIHHASFRSNGPFVALNCAALPEPLLESLLFGHKRGAFTGADKDQQGAFQAAHGGTMLLDEIGDMPYGLQSKLLRVLQDGEIVPIGQQRPEKVDVRVIASTNRVLVKDIGKNFRPDLYYRLAVLTVNIPPLRARVTDIPLLVEKFVAHYAELWGRKRQNTIGGEALQTLMSYHWPGNVRELENEMARAVAVAGDGILICSEQLAPHIRHETQLPSLDLEPLVDAVISGRLTFDHAVGSVEKALIERAMAQSGGIMTAAAELLGTTRKRLSYNLFHRIAQGESTTQTLAAAVSDVEWRLISEALEEAKGNRADAARILGVKRTTLFAKIKRYLAEHPEVNLEQPN